MPEPFAQLAINFAQALVDGNFELAASFLTPQLRADLTPAKLQANLLAMCNYGDGYGHMRPSEVHYMPCEDDLETNWPAKQPGDVGWAYIAVEGSEFSEAVIPTVCSINGQLLIRDVEWGRP